MILLAAHRGNEGQVVIVNVCNLGKDTVCRFSPDAQDINKHIHLECDCCSTRSMMRFTYLEPFMSGQLIQ